MSEKIRDFFVRKPEVDNSTGSTIIKSVWGLVFSLNDSVTKKFLNEYFFISGTFSYIQKGGSDKLILQINLSYYGEKKPFDILKKFSCEFIPDNNGSFAISNGVNYSCKSLDMILNSFHQEEIDFEIKVNDFLKLVNANRIAWKIDGLDEGELDDMRLMDIKGVYNSIFDPEFETDLLEKYVDKRQEELRKHREKEELEKKEKEKAKNAQKPNKEPLVEPKKKPAPIYKPNPLPEKKSSSKTWLILFVIACFFIWKRCNDMKNDRKQETAEVIGVDAGSSNSSSNNIEPEIITEPGKYRIDYRLTQPVVVYRDVLRSKKSKFQFKPMQKVSIIKVENGLGYFEDFINYESQKGWIEMNKLVKLEPLNMGSFGERYRVNSKEINGIQVYKDFFKKNAYSKKLQPMEVFEVFYVINDMGCNIDEIGGFKVQWVEMDKLEKQN